MVEAVEKGLVNVDRIDVSVRRLLREKFRLGLFDNPFVDVDAVVSVVGRPEFVARGEDVQRRSVTVLTNNEQILPLRKGIRLYVEGVDAEIVAPFATVVDSPAGADVGVASVAVRRTSHGPVGSRRCSTPGRWSSTRGRRHARQRSMPRCRRSWTSTSNAPR